MFHDLTCLVVCRVNVVSHLCSELKYVTAVVQVQLCFSCTLCAVALKEIFILMSLFTWQSKWYWLFVFFRCLRYQSITFSLPDMPLRQGVFCVALSHLIAWFWLQFFDSDTQKPHDSISLLTLFCTHKAHCARRRSLLSLNKPDPSLVSHRKIIITQLWIQVGSLCKKSWSVHWKYNYS